MNRQPKRNLGRTIPLGLALITAGGAIYTAQPSAQLSVLREGDPKPIPPAPSPSPPGQPIPPAPIPPPKPEPIPPAR